MWKPLSIVSGVALLAGSGIMYGKVRPALIAERTQAENALGYKESAEKQQAEAEAAVKTAETELESMKSALSKAEREKAEAAAKKEEIAKQVEEATTSKDAAAKDLADLEQKMKDLGGLDAMVAELKAQEGKRVEYDRQIAAAKSGIESALSRKASLDKQISELKRIDLWQQTGTMAPTFRSRITAVNPDWGFVTIGSGNGSSVVRQAKLDVVRGGSLVGKVVVTHVSPNSSAAEIVPGSVAPGDSILPGDQVRTGAGSLPSNMRVAPPAAPAPAKTEDGTGAVPDGAPAAEPEAVVDPFATPAEPAPVEPAMDAADTAPADAAPADDAFAPAPQ